MAANISIKVAIKPVIANTFMLYMIKSEHEITSVILMIFKLPYHKAKLYNTTAIIGNKLIKPEYVNIEKDIIINIIIIKQYIGTLFLYLLNI